MLNSAEIKFTDVNGVERTIDFNPIKAEKSGTIEEYLARSNKEYNSDVYYQSEFSSENVVDLTNDFVKTPTLDEVKDYINKIVESGTKFATLSPDFVVDIQDSSKKKKHIINSTDFKTMNRAEKSRHNKYIMSLEKLLANAKYSGGKDNTKKDKKPNVEKYHYFTTDVKIGDKMYEIVFDTEEYKKESSSSANVLRSVKNLKEDSDNSINDNKNNFNPKTVHLYNIKEIKRFNQDDQQQNDIKATVEKLHRIKGAYVPAQNLIELFKNADESTIVHEFAHWWLDRLNKYSKDNEELALDMEAVRKFVGNEGEDFTYAQHEKFARGFEAYIRSGYAKTNRLKKIFEDFKNALLSIYDSIKQLGFKEDEIPQIQGLFDRLLTSERERIIGVFFLCKKTQLHRCYSEQRFFGLKPYE